MANDIRELGIGQNLGTGLSSALSELARGKISKIQQQEAQNKQLQGLAALFEPQQAQALSNLDPELLKPVITEKAKSQRQLATTGPGIKTIAPDLSPEQAEKIGKLPASVQNLWYKNYLDSPDRAIEALNQTPKQFTKPDIKKFAQENLQQAKKEKNEGLESVNNNPSINETKISPEKERLNTIQDTIKKLSPEAKTASELMKENPKLTLSEAKDQVKDQRKEGHIARKESEDFYNALLKAEKGADSGDKRLDRMEHLLDKGSLPYAIAYKTIKNMGESDIHTSIPIVGPFVDLLLNGVIKNAGGLAEYTQKGITAKDTEEFEKLTEDFTRDAKDVYGARVTNQELTQFLKMIPNLLQTDYGKRAVIRNMKNFNEAARIKARTMKEIIKANNGKRPDNFAIIIDEIAKPELDRLAEEYKLGINDIAKYIKPVELPFQHVLGNENIQV